MEAIVCKNCASNELEQRDGMLVCPYCGTSYPIPEQMKVRTSVISLQDDIDKLLMRCRLDPSNARRYASLVLDLDPNNCAARKYL